MVRQCNSQTRVLFGICDADIDIYLYSMHLTVYTVMTAIQYIQISFAGCSKNKATRLTIVHWKKSTLSNCQCSIDLKDRQHQFKTPKFDTKKCSCKVRIPDDHQALPSQPRWRNAKIFLRFMTGLCSQDLVEEVWPLTSWHLQQSLHCSIVDARNLANHLGSKT